MGVRMVTEAGRHLPEDFKELHDALVNAESVEQFLHEMAVLAARSGRPGRPRAHVRGPQEPPARHRGTGGRRAPLRAVPGAQAGPAKGPQAGPAKGPQAGPAKGPRARTASAVAKHTSAAGQSWPPSSAGPSPRGAGCRG